MLKAISELVVKLPWSMIILFCLTLGLAPFFPIPHVWEKLKMFSSGTLVRPINWFDLIMHAAPWILLLIKIVLTMKENGVSDNS